MDADANYCGARRTDALNRYQTPGYALLRIGARYRFDWRGTPAALRLRVYKVGDEYAWIAGTRGIQA
ncbi:hypothetical protein [Lysobacter sp. cf310]|uniref:hypothetical protein n=1 Tax=Lysobacter sp. cf310 TaxID=1761790 RepID=UPI001113422B|nr:hypothetical protein [Lysobacter sp. cf310]